MPKFAVYPNLKGKRILVTGGASGIGSSTVEAFAEQGADIAFLDRDKEASERVSANGARVTRCVNCATFLPCRMQLRGWVRSTCSSTMQRVMTGTTGKT